MWEFETDPEYQAKLDWADAFVREELEGLRFIIEEPLNIHDPLRNAIIKPLQAKVKARGLWATHLGPELGGKGHGQLKLALLNEILGRTPFAPIVFGCAAPDTGNAEILAHYGTAEHTAMYQQPLLDGELFSCYSMTAPQGGSDPIEFTCRAWLEGDEWVIEGEKWFSSHARYASFLIVMVVTDPDAKPHERMSMLIVPAETPGIEIIRNVATMNERDDLDEGTEGYIRYNKVRVPLDAMLGAPGEGFKVAQSRLGGGRVHHAMRVVGKCQRAFDMMCERALSRRTQGKLLAEHQFVQGFIADSAIQLQQFRLLVLQTAWIIDNQPHGAARTHIAMCKVALAGVLHDILQRAVQLHGSLGTTQETPLGPWWAYAPQLALADGPTEVHKAAVAKQMLRGYAPAPGLFPTEHIPTRRAAARSRYAELLGEHGR